MENQTGKTNRKVLNLAPEQHGWLDLLEGALVGDVVACLSIAMAVETTSPDNGEALVSQSLFCFGRSTCSLFVNIHRCQDVRGENRYTTDQDRWQSHPRLPLASPRIAATT